MRCRKHPRYQGKGKPRLACAPCWWVYFHGTKHRNWRCTGLIPYMDLEYED